jgi:peptide/nickel transport system ATP-binding protein/oligopeptide transport system ATP-binding protein
MSLLEIRDLRTHIAVPGGTARAVDGVDLSMMEGETVGVVGESGSGKTVLALSILGLLSEEHGGILPGSSIRLHGEELVGTEKKRLREIRGGEIAMIFQEPMTSLNPVFTVGNQIQEALELHRALSGAEGGEETIRLLAEVGIPDPERRIRDYPHQFSGGMRQRVMIAMALAGEPALLIADEPTTALDVTIEAQILQLLKEVQSRLGMGLLFISHDLGVVSKVCERMVILYGGRVVEAGSTQDILGSPKHPYTRGLMGSRLSLDDRRATLRPIPGEVPDATNWPGGCRFHPRCSEVVSRCRRDEPGLVAVEGDPRDVRCWLYVENGGTP